MWFSNILVHSWLPEGRSGKWSVKRTVIPGSEAEWLAKGGNPRGWMLAPGTYTGLFRTLDGGIEERVMFDEPREIMEAEGFVEQAHGKVLLTGLGIGMVAAWVASKPEVTQVDVIENSEDVIALVAPYLPSPKIRVIQADAFSYVTDETHDVAWHDCFYTKPERIEELIARYHIPVQGVWQPSKMIERVAITLDSLWQLLVLAPIYLGASMVQSWRETWSS